MLSVDCAHARHQESSLFDVHNIDFRTSMAKVANSVLFFERKLNNFASGHSRCIQLSLAINRRAADGVCKLCGYGTPLSEPPASSSHRMLQSQSVRVLTRHNIHAVEIRNATTDHTRSHSTFSASLPLKHIAVTDDKPPEVLPEPHVPNCVDPNQPLESSPAPPPLAPRQKLKCVPQQAWLF